MADLFDITGIDAVLRNLQQQQSVVVPILAIALQQECDAILASSQPLVPVDTGSLQESGKVDDPTINGLVAQCGVRYGGTVGRQGRVPERYAIRVHEDTTMNHPRGGQHHYLSQAAFAATQGMLARLADAVRIAL